MLKEGSRVGRWVILARGEDYVNPKRGTRHTRFQCVCDCGVARLVRESSLKSGESTSCGCYAREQSKTRISTHGMALHPLFGIWFDMNRRCYDPSRKDYRHYGGRGIEVCDKWKRQDDGIEEGLKNFINDMYPTYQENLEIERTDVNSNYCPENCIWDTRRNQVINRRPTGAKGDAKFIEYKGKTLCISQWADEIGIKAQVLVDRLGKLGWSVDKAFSTPLMNRGKKNDS